MTPPDIPQKTEITQYRQPMVTSVGIILGFLTNFLASWATSDDGQPALQSGADYVVAGAFALGIVLMIWVLARLMTNRLPEATGPWYHRTFRLYLTAVLITFVGLGLALLI